MSCPLNQELNKEGLAKYLTKHSNHSWLRFALNGPEFEQKSQNVSQKIDLFSETLADYVENFIQGLYPGTAAWTKYINTQHVFLL